MNIWQFLVEVRSELAKVVWPSRVETVRYTVTVILFSIGTALILGLADFGFLKAFEAILK